MNLTPLGPWLHLVAFFSKDGGLLGDLLLLWEICAREFGARPQSVGRNGRDEWRLPELRGAITHKACGDMLVHFTQEILFQGGLGRAVPLVGQGRPKGHAETLQRGLLHPFRFHHESIMLCLPHLGLRRRRAYPSSFKCFPPQH